MPGSPSPLANRAPGDIDFVVVRENTEGEYSSVGGRVFEGTAREIIRIGTSYARHPVGDLLFNPLARPGDADYGNLYISTGDGEAGERAGQIIWRDLRQPQFHSK